MQKHYINNGYKKKLNPPLMYESKMYLSSYDTKNQKVALAFGGG